MKTKIISSFVLILSIFLFSFNTSTAQKNNKPFIVVLDAGHGGKDSGNRGNGFYEKDIVLDVTLQVGKLLEAQDNVKVVYTRKTDVFIDLYRRGPIANEVDADIFVSIHCDSHNSQAQGIGTFVMGVDKSGKNFETAKKENEVIYLEDNYHEKYAGFDPNSPQSFIGFSLMQEEYLDQSIMLAGLIQNNIVNNLKRKDRSVRSAPFWVLHSSYMPSVLVELGFLTNNTEGPYVNSSGGRSELAKEITNGILLYKKQITLATEDFKNPVITNEKVEKAIENTVENIYEGITFKVQLAASSRKLDPKPSNFKGIKDVSRDKEDGLFKYYYGETSDYNKIQLMKTFVQQKGYQSAYIVAFKKGKKVNVPEVLKSKAN
ncbi:N-acetylmuramoyl-L-alanine amidase [Aequorivita sublithincola DSM 14238]|uniref:N-acetylmuramoyl-L-alanine amidase n=1 Tax=Aequorivita sublithincola (strain DSM 14238 / LMG 21431 / ACAM 643 / 9-3) TaxID=746697 RepID=I3YYY1_AEQSU|nr:N-acetylmuramoyl-L-alanine amidase [Aequorivita sublithincola]AFL82199.1 N-acetylmuramoyl-L-alanine amidase [Aequorivita sublithincola DSM 14238]